jgi:SAM-dependent methyltransferase
VAQPSPDAAPGGYLFDNRSPEAGRRFDSLAALFNPVTFRHFDALGVDSGWRCWEVGAGGVSVPQWLSSKVGASGRVLVTDIDVSWTEGAEAENVEVLRHDVAAEDPPEDGFDLVHARLVLIHVRARERAMDHMISTLRPGGWALIEDFDPALQPFACVDILGPEHERANKIRAGVRSLLAEHGADLQFGRRLPRLLREAGLVDVAADAFMPLALPGVAELETANINQVREGLIAGGHATSEEIDAHLLAVQAGRLDVTTPFLVSAWGRRPKAERGDTAPTSSS